MHDVAFAYYGNKRNDRTTRRRRRHFMTLTEYNKWLRKLDADRVELIELTGFDGIQNQVFYISSLVFKTGPTDSLPNIQFTANLEKSSTLSRSISFFDEGRGIDDVGEINIINNDGFFDFWQDYHWKGRSIRILLGDPTWSYDDFLVKPVLVGVIKEKPEFNDSLVSFRIQDKLGSLDVPVQRNLIVSTDSSNNNPFPICLGTVENIKPVLIESATHKYKWHTGPVDSIGAIYFKGSAVTSFTTDNANGEFTLTTRPIGTVTLDGNGAKPAGTHLTKIGEIAEYLITEFGGLSAGEIDTTSFAQLNIDKPYDLEYYISDRQNLLDVLDSLFSSVGAFYLINYEGKVIVGHIKDPANETAVESFDGNNIQLDNFSVKPLGTIQWRTRLFYNRNFTVQADGDLAGSITDPTYPDAARVDFLGTEWRTASDEDISVVPGGTDFNLVEEPDAIITNIHSLADATTEAQYRQNILGKQRFICSFTGKATPFGLIPGDIIEVTDNLKRYGLAVPTKMQILSLVYYSSDYVVDVEAWY